MSQEFLMGLLLIPAAHIQKKLALFLYGSHTGAFISEQGYDNAAHSRLDLEGLAGLTKVSKGNVDV